jgi:hypothetical protein
MLSQFGRIAPILMGMIAALAAASAHAQAINIDEGKTPTQVFASDCAVCHKAPRGLAKDSNPRSLADFLRQHYTSSREQAAAMASYLLAAGPEPRGAGQRPAAAAKSGQGPGAARAGRTPEEQDATPDSRTRRGRQASQPPRPAEEGIITEEHAPRPPRGIPERSHPPGAKPPPPDAAEGRAASPSPRTRRGATGTAQPAAHEPAASATTTAAPASEGPAAAAAATSIDSVISRTAQPTPEPDGSKPVPTRQDDIPD